MTTDNPILRDLIAARLAEQDAPFYISDLRAKLDGTREARITAAMEAIDGKQTKDDVEIIINPTQEQVPKGGAGGCWWRNDRVIYSREVGVVFPDYIGILQDNYAIITHGYLTPTELVERVKKMLDDKVMNDIIPSIQPIVK